MQARERLIQNHAGAMVIVATALLVIGVVMVTSASARLDQSFLAVSVWQSVFGRQAIFAVVGFLLMILVERWGQPLLAAPSGRKAAKLAPFRQNPAKMAHSGSVMEESRRRGGGPHPIVPQPAARGRVSIRTLDRYRWGRSTAMWWCNSRDEQEPR